MSTMAKWGSKTWTVNSEKVVALEGIRFSYSQVADPTDGKKETSKQNINLFALSFSTTLHAGAGVNIEKEIDSWESLVTKVDYFYLGGKNLGPRLQLRNVSVSNIKLDDFGRMRLATISFEFKEYDADTTSVKAEISTNQTIKKATKNSIKVGSYVKLIGKKYVDGEEIPTWVKQRNHKVSKIKKKQNEVLLGNPDGIDKWAYLSEVSLI